MSAWFEGSTHWSMLLVTGGEQTEAWEYFYANYHEAVEALFAHRGVPPDQTRDMAHEFFLTAFESAFLSKADPSRGRFRAYLRTAATRFLVSEWRKRGRQKRSPAGGVVELREHVHLAAKTSLSPEEAFDLAWARGILERAMTRTRETFAKKGKAQQFEAFAQRQDGSSWADVAANLGTTHRAARAWGGRVETVLARFLRLEVSGTVGGAKDLDAELAELAAILDQHG